MSKKRILITMTYMHIGGAERSLLGLLDSIDYTKYEVDLFLFCHEGAYMPMIPSEVNLFPEIKAYKALTTPLDELKTIDKKAYWKKKAAVTIARLMYAAKGSKCSENGVTLWCEKLLVPGLPRINDREYDLGISFMAYHSILSKKANCKKKIAWFHSDYSKVNPLRYFDYRSWNTMDKIVMVSDDCRRSFLKVYPTLSYKTVSIENILPLKQVLTLASQISEVDEYVPTGSYILSLGRLCAAKAYTRAIKACSIIKQRGYKIKWLVVGEGEERNLLEEQIKRYNLEDSFLLLGAFTNPYPYIAGCSIFVQTSDYEGKSVAIREAQMLGCPVLITNYETAKGQVENGVDGIIVDMTAESVAEGIIQLLENPQLQEQLSNTCKHRDYSNAKEIEKIYDIIN